MSHCRVSGLVIFVLSEFKLLSFSRMFVTPHRQLVITIETYWWWGLLMFRRGSSGKMRGHSLALVVESKWCLKIVDFYVRSFFCIDIIMFFFFIIFLTDTLWRSVELWCLFRRMICNCNFALAICWGFSHLFILLIRYGQDYSFAIYYFDNWLRNLIWQK